MIVPDSDTDKFPSKKRDEIDNDAIPNTYVPARNTIFLSYALAVAEVTDASHIVIGVSSVDYSGYPIAVRVYRSIWAHGQSGDKSGRYRSSLVYPNPTTKLSKAQTIELGLSLGVDYGQTISCYRADANGLLGRLW